MAACPSASREPAESCWSPRSSDTTPCREQDESLVTYAEKITPEDRRLRPDASGGSSWNEWSGR